MEKLFNLHVLLINLGNADIIADQSKPISRVRRTVCGTRRYDPRFETCCSGVISPKRGLDTAFCGTKRYNARFSICCSGVVSPLCGLDTACCGTRIYNPSFNIVATALYVDAVNPR